MPLCAQDATSLNDSLRVTKITIIGNKKTRPQIILRELSFKVGTNQSKMKLRNDVEWSRQQLINTSLFVDAKITPILSDSTVEMTIELKERWYFFPLIYFRLVDRNFNQWWVDQNKSLERVNYGIKFTQNNVTGRKDNLDVWLIAGYTQQVNLRYDLPYIDKKLKSGINVGIGYLTQKEVNFATGNNKQLFFNKEEQFLRKQFRADFTYTYRPAYSQRHSFRISYNDETVSDSVLVLTPNYYANNQTRFKYVDFNYKFKYYHADINFYPTNGFMFEGNIYKRGLWGESNLWMFNARAVYAIPLAKNSFLHFEGTAQWKFPDKAAFTDQRLLGYGSFQMRGLEYNVVDGLKGVMLRSTVHQKLLGFEIKNPIKSKTHDRIPVRIYIKAFTDLGYANIKNQAPSNTLNNKFLYTYGFGIDIVSIYDFVFKIEYSFNQLGVDGLYLHSRNDF